MCRIYIGVNLYGDLTHGGLSTGELGRFSAHEKTVVYLALISSPDSSTSIGNTDNGDLMETAAASSSLHDKKETSNNESGLAAGDSCPREELLELVRAIKFAKPEASQKQVHREITEELSQKYSQQFAFLKDVRLTDVKKVWKKALKQRDSSRESAASASISSTTSPQEAQANPNADLISKLPQNGEPIQVFTVGDASVKHLAQEYTAAVLAQAAAKEQALQDELSNYVHVFLDVPADKSGSRPQQALINFQSNTASHSSSSATTNKSGKKGKKKSASAATSNSTLNLEEDVIVKIQAAAPLDESDTIQHPMLLYDKTRELRTFIHPSPDDDSYEKIAAWIHKTGHEGVLGMRGGLKAYFYSRLTVRKKGSSILSIKTTELAPPQEW